mgnify:CR=1 FL=1
MKHLVWILAVFLTSYSYATSDSPNNDPECQLFLESHSEIYSKEFNKKFEKIRAVLEEIKWDSITTSEIGGESFASSHWVECMYQLGEKDLCYIQPKTPETFFNYLKEYAEKKKLNPVQRGALAILVTQIMMKLTLPSLAMHLLPVMAFQSSNSALTEGYGVCIKKAGAAVLIAKKLGLSQAKTTAKATARIAVRERYLLITLTAIYLCALIIEYDKIIPDLEKAFISLSQFPISLCLASLWIPQVMLVTLAKYQAKYLFIQSDGTNYVLEIDYPMLKNSQRILIHRIN